MAAATAMAVAGLATAAIGAMGSDSSSSQPRQYGGKRYYSEPFETSGTFGNVNYSGGKDGQLTGQLPAAEQQAMEYYNSVQSRGANGGSAAERAMAHFGVSQGAEDMQRDYTNMRSEMGTDITPNYFNQTEAAALSQFGAIGEAQRLNAGVGEVMADQGMASFGRGNRMANNAENYGDFQAQRLQLLRDQAQPQMERDRNDMMQSLFSKGILGTEGGARAMQAFGTAQSEADTSRILASQDQAQQMRMQDLQMSGQFTNQGFMAGGQVSNSIRQGAAYSADGTQLAGNMMDSAVGYEGYRLNRAQQRVAASQQLLGFGRGLQDSNTQRVDQAVAGRNIITDNQRQNAALAGHLRQGGGYTPSGVMAGTPPSALSGFASGFGNSLINAAAPAVISKFSGGSSSTPFNNAMTNPAPYQQAGSYNPFAQANASAFSF